MADDTEKIAMVIETQAQLAGLRQASAGLADVTAQAATTNQQVRITAEQSAAAWAKADGSVHDYNLEINRLVAAQRQAATASTATTQATTQATVATAAASDVAANRLAPSLRSSSLAASRLTLAFDGMGGGVQGVARSVGMLSYGVADLAGPGLAAMASGVAAGAIVLATLGDLLYKDAQRAVALSDAFKDHLGNLKFDATRTAIDDVHKAMGGLETQIPTLTQKLGTLLQFGPSAFTSSSNSFLTNLRHELTLTTDAEDLFNQKLKENEALGARSAEQTKALAEATAELNAAYQSNVFSTAAKAKELQDQIAGNTYAAQRVSLVEAERVQVEEINKRYADYAKNNKALTFEQIVQQQTEIANARTQLSLGLRLVDVQKQKADAAKAQALADATAGVRARGAGATSDVDGPVGTFNKRLIEIDKEYNDATVKQHVDATVAKETRDAEYARAYRDMTNALIAEDERREQATARINESRDQAGSDLNKPQSRLAIQLVRADADAAKQEQANAADTDAAEAARLARKARAWRDYYAEIDQAQRENDDAISASRSDIDEADSDEAATRLAIWREYYDNLGKLGISMTDQQMRRDQALARLDRDVFVASISHLKQSASAAESYGGVVGQIAKATGDAIRRGELAWNAYKDFGKGKSEGAAALADAASGNFVGAALHGAASVAYFAAAGFEAAGALGAGGSSGGAGGAGGGAQASTFTPSDANKSGGQTIIFQQIGAFDRHVIAATAFYMEQQSVLKVPMILPPSTGLITGRAA